MLCYITLSFLLERTPLLILCLVLFLGSFYILWMKNVSKFRDTLLTVSIGGELLTFFPKNSCLMIKIISEIIVISCS